MWTGILAGVTVAALLLLGRLWQRVPAYAYRSESA
jgi:hypothetical protein